MVGIDKILMKNFGQMVPNGRFTRAHRTDQKDTVCPAHLKGMPASRTEIKIAALAGRYLLERQIVRDNARRKENKQFRLVVRDIFGLEKPAEQRQIAKKRNF